MSFALWGFHNFLNALQNGSLLLIKSRRGVPGVLVTHQDRRTVRQAKLGYLIRLYVIPSSRHVCEWDQQKMTLSSAADGRQEDRKMIRREGGSERRQGDASFNSSFTIHRSAYKEIAVIAELQGRKITTSSRCTIKTSRESRNSEVGVKGIRDRNQGNHEVALLCELQIERLPQVQHVTIDIPLLINPGYSHSVAVSV